MVSAAQLAYFQSVVKRAFDKTCIIQRETKTPDGFGHDAQSTWTTLNGGVIACGFYQPQGGKQLTPVGGSLASPNLWKLQVAVGTDIRTGDRVILGTDTLHVQTVNNEESLPVCLDVTVMMIEGSKEDTP